MEKNNHPEGNERETSSPSFEGINAKTEERNTKIESREKGVRTLFEKQSDNTSEKIKALQGRLETLVTQAKKTLSLASASAIVLVAMNSHAMASEGDTQKVGEARPVAEASADSKSLSEARQVVDATIEIIEASVSKKVDVIGNKFSTLTDNEASLATKSGAILDISSMTPSKVAGKGPQVLKVLSGLSELRKNQDNIVNGFTTMNNNETSLIEQSGGALKILQSVPAHFIKKLAPVLGVLTGLYELHKDMAEQQAFHDSLSEEDRGIRNHEIEHGKVVNTQKKIGLILLDLVSAGYGSSVYTFLAERDTTITIEQTVDEQNKQTAILK